MISVLICPCCGAPLAADATACEYCRIRFGTLEKATNIPEYKPQPVQVPQDWKQHNDPWYGFEVAHPPGWWVFTRPGIVSVREDPSGITAADVYTFPNDRGLSARAFFQVFLSNARLLQPDFVAWEAPGHPGEGDRLQARFQTTYLGVPITGFYNVSVQKDSILMSGFGCRIQVVEQQIDTFRKILASFHPIERMRRTMRREPSENAYAVWAPEDWQANVQLNRQNINNAGSLRFAVQRESKGFAQAGQPDLRWNFSESQGWMMPSITPVMPYMPASLFCQNFIAPMASQQCQEMKVENIVNRPDMALNVCAEMLKIGMDPTGYELTNASMDITYRENGVLLRQRGYVHVMRPRMGLMGGLWNPSLESVLRAPVEEWDDLEPVLMGIIDSVQVNPAWKAQEDAGRMHYLAYSAADRMRRQQEISRTISETSDILFQSYERRSQSQDRIAHAWSNATLGVQDMADSSGSIYSVPSGYDQYWLDNTDTLQVGNWLANPDPTWRKLEPK